VSIDRTKNSVAGSAMELREPRVLVPAEVGATAFMV